MQVIVTNKSSFSYFLTIAIESWYNYYIYLVNSVKDNDKIIFLSILSIIASLSETISCNSKYISVLRFCWLFLYHLKWFDSHLVYWFTKYY